MFKSKKSALGTVTRSHTALGLLAATLLIGGSVTEASAKSRHHHHRHHHVAKHHQQVAKHRHHHVAKASAGASANADANAAVSSSGTTGHSFSGVASFYGNESGSQTASGQRFSENAMTCAHRSLPFGTKLRVTHGGQSVVVTVNDRGPFIKGRVLDLSTAAARAVGLTSAGVGHVTAEVI
jgi:rare lipoprotein A